MPWQGACSVSSPGPDLLALEKWVADALSALDAPARRKLFAKLGRELRKRNRKRMTAQTGPDGERWQPRAKDAGKKVRERAKMMVGLRDDRRLLLSTSPAGLDLGWAGAAARIAAVHHHGEFDLVAPNSNTKVRYPQRRLIGLPAGDLDYVRQQLLDLLATGSA